MTPLLAVATSCDVGTETGNGVERSSQPERGQPARSQRNTKLD